MSTRDHPPLGPARRPRLPLALWGILVLVYVLVLGSFGPWDLAAGAVAATAILWTCRRVLRETGWSPSGAATLFVVPHLMALVLAALPGSFVALVRFVLGVRPPRPGFVTISTKTWDPAPSASGLAVLGWMAMLIPGSILAEVDSGAGTLTFHLIEASAPSRFVERLRRIYTVQSKVLP